MSDLAKRRVSCQCLFQPFTLASVLTPPPIPCVCTLFRPNSAALSCSSVFSLSGPLAIRDNFYLRTHLPPRRTHLPPRRTHLPPRRTHLPPRRTHLPPRRTHLPPRRTHLPPRRTPPPSSSHSTSLRVALTSLRVALTSLLVALTSLLVVFQLSVFSFNWPINDFRLEPVDHVFLLHQLRNHKPALVQLVLHDGRHLL
ncbi:hypothetical protein BLNAU_19263 [Blattamonas nauphoetae]|uniref:Uncharacterized protein n=1 Tax=Blattamonas nauphoetae TaxID=2049346 RepID=A0ABQ9X628_9EUKA|nr:hypothetical protein BLNAU_19263 [Blattamonas nauphoetae]